MIKTITKNENNNSEIFSKIHNSARQIDQDYFKMLLSTLIYSITSNYVQCQESLTAALTAAIEKIDVIISQQLLEIIHHKEFQKLEGTWRGLHYLVMNAETGKSLKIKILNLPITELQRDLKTAKEFDQSKLFKKIYEEEFGTPGGEPYSILLADYEFSNSSQDTDCLAKLSNLAAAAFCPVIAAASPKMFGFDNWQELAMPRDLEKIFSGLEFVKWRAFRESEDARFVTLTLPRILARLPYGEKTQPVTAFRFEEEKFLVSHEQIKSSHEKYCWMNAAFALGARICDAIVKYGWPTAMRGAEGGGKVANLPLHCFLTEAGDYDAQCPTEIAIADRREAELSKLGFLPICHYKNTDYAVFFGGQTTQLPKKYDKREATANAQISARLPYLLATSRFAHYLKVMARDKIGSYMEAADCEIWLNRWIKNYINGNAASSQDLKAKYPLAEARIEVKEIDSQPGSYHAIAWLRPWLQFEELTTSMRLVARIPKLTKS